MPLELLKSEASAAASVPDVPASTIAGPEPPARSRDGDRTLQLGPADRAARARRHRWFRLALAAAIGAGVGCAANLVFAGMEHAFNWWLIATGALSAPLFTRGSGAEGWLRKGIFDGTKIGAAAYLVGIVLLLTFSAIRDPGILLWLWAVVAVYFPLILAGPLVTVPCGWIAGVIYHFAAERLRLDAGV